MLFIAVLWKGTENDPIDWKIEIKRMFLQKIHGNIFNFPKYLNEY